MARRLNTRLLVHVLVFLGVPAGLLVLAFFMGWFSGGDPKQLYEDAQEYYEKEEYAQAWIAIRRAVKAGAGKNPEVLNLMGDIALRQNPPGVSQAVQAYRSAVRLKPDYLEAQRKLAELYLGLRYWKEALAEVKRVQELDPTSGDGYLWEARVHVGLARAEPIQSKKTPHYEAAAAACEKGLEQAPDRLELYRVLAHVYRQLERPEKLDEVIDLALKNNPENPDAYLLKSSRLVSQDRTEEAVKTLEKGLAAVGPNAQLSVALGEVALRENDVDAATKYFQGAIEADPHDATGYLRLAGIYRVEREREKAVQVLTQGLEQNPDSTELLAQQADMYLEMGERQKADEIIARLEKLGEGSGAVEFLKGKRALASRQVRQAIAYLEQARDKQPGPRAQLRLGQAYLLAGEVGAAEKELQSLVDERPGLTPAWRILVEAQLRLHRFDRAVRSARVVLQRQPRDTETRLHLARALLAQKKADEALAEAKKAAQNAEGDPEPLLLMASVYQVMDRNDLAEQTYRKALEVGEDDVEVYRQFMVFYRRTNQEEKLKALVEQAKKTLPSEVLVSVSGNVDEIEQELRKRAEAGDAPAADILALADFYRATDRPDDAKPLYQQVLEKAEPRSGTWRNAWQRLFLLRLIADEYKEAAELVERQKVADPDAPELLFADPLLLLRQKKTAEAVKALREIIQKYPSLSQGHFMLGQVLAGQQKYEEAIASLNKALESRPNLIPARMLLARIYRQRGNYAAVLSEAEEALRFNPRLVPALEMKALAHAGQGQWQRALETRQRIAEVVPDNVGNLIALAALYVQQHEPEKAEKAFQRAYARQPDNPILVRSMADFYADTNRRQKGAEIVDAYVKKHPDEAEAYVIRGEFKANISGPEEAEPDFRKAAELKPGDPLPLIFLGDQYSRLGQWEKASNIYTAAAERGKNANLARKRLADVYMLQGELEKAREVIDKVLAKAPEDAAALVVAGRIAARQDKPEEAKRLIQKALELRPGYGEAKVRLAELYASPDPMRALEILADVDPSDRSFEKAQLLRADINTRRVQLTEAILDLRRLLDFRPTSIPGRLQLASKYMAREEYGRAAALLEELSRERLNQDPALLVALGDARMKQKQYQAALAAYEQARQVKPESSEALTGEVRALVALGREKDALDRVHQAMNKWDQEVWPRMALVALYQQTGEIQKAFETLRTGLLRNEKWERGYVHLADLLVQKQRKDEARQILLTGLSKVPDSVPIRAGLAALEIGFRGPEAAARILEPLAKEFEAKYSRTPERIRELRAYMPSVRIYSLALYRMGEIEKALKWGMMLWSLDPTDVANANNMAWILATEQKDYDRARDMIHRCMRLVPNHPQVLDTAGWIEFLDQRYDAAVENLLASIKYGDNAEARYHLGRVYEARERPDEAREQYKKALDLGLTGQERADAERRLNQLASAAG